MTDEKEIEIQAEIYTKEKLDFIKNKYRNGVTRDILNEILAR